MDSGSSDDHYAVLGIDAGVDRAELRRAWRRLALRWHPDRAGADATATFQRLLAAYNVLSDPITRASYDRRRGAPVYRPAPDPPPAGPRRQAPGMMLERLSGALHLLLATGAARRTGDVIELLLTAAEARSGGMATIALRVAVRCRACTADTVAACAHCQAIGTVDELFSAWLAVPPEVADGAVLTPTQLLPGMTRPVSFRARVPAAR